MPGICMVIPILIIFPVLYRKDKIHRLILRFIEKKTGFDLIEWLEKKRILSHILKIDV